MVATSTTDATIMSQKPKNFRIEIKCTKETKDDFDAMVIALIPGLHNKLGRKVQSEDIIKCFLEIYKKQNWVFKENELGKAQIR